MMLNDTNMTNQLQNFKMENQFLNYCVGKSVGEKSTEVSRHVSKVQIIGFSPTANWQVQDSQINYSFVRKSNEKLNEFDFKVDQNTIGIVKVDQVI